MKIKDILQIKYGKNQSSVVDENGKYPIIGTGGIFGYANDYLYDRPSVLIGRKGTINNPMYITQPFWTVDTLFYTIMDTQKVIPRWFYYYISTIDLTRLNEGTTIPSLTTKTLYEVDVPEHSLEYQQHIVDIIGSIDDKIENNNKIIEKIWEKLQLIHNDFKNKNELIKKNILELADIKYGKSIPIAEILKDGLYSVYGSNGVVGYLNNYTFKEHKIAISCRGNSSGFIHLTDEKSTITSNSLVLDFKDFNYTYYFFLEFMHKGLYEYTTGSAQPQITIDNLKVLNFQVPINIDFYISLVNDNIKYAFNLKKENVKLTDLKQLYLKKFFR